MTALGRLIIVGVLLASFAGGLVRADDKAEREAIQGTWIFTRHEIDGNNGGGTEDDKLSITIQGEKYAIRLDAAIVQQARFKIDTSKRPRTIDVQVGEGQDAGKTLLGIYELDGDTFKACFDATGKARPTEFKTASGSGRILIEAKRKK